MMTHASGRTPTCHAVWMKSTKKKKKQELIQYYYIGIICKNFQQQKNKTSKVSDVHNISHTQSTLITVHFNFLNRSKKKQESVVIYFFFFLDFNLTFCAHLSFRHHHIGKQKTSHYFYSEWYGSICFRKSC